MMRARIIPASFAAVLLAAVISALAGQAGNSFTVIDSLGRKVIVPERVDRIISLEPEISRIIVALGAGDRLVGIDYFLRNHDRLFPLIFPPAERLPIVSNPGQELNYEEAIRLRPDIIFASPSEFRMTETIERKMRIPVVALASMGRFRELLGEIETLGRILGREDRAAKLVELSQTKLDAIRRLTSAKPDKARPLVYLSFWGSLVRTPVGYEPVDVAGGRNAASAVILDYLGAAGATVSIEKILAWNPEVILVQGNYLPEERQITVEGILRDPRLASLRAVRAGRVHYTFGFWYWWDPALVLVETLYLSHVFYPEEIPAPDLIKEGDSIFKDFYGAERLFSALCRILACYEWTTQQ